jgi:hypothetical protein
MIGYLPKKTVLYGIRTKKNFVATGDISLYGDEFF